MRSLCTYLAFTILAVALAASAPGCGGASTELAKPPDTTKQVNPENDMPGFKDMQNKMKKQ